MARKLAEELVNLLVEHYAKSRSVVKTARHFNVGSTSVHRALKARGIECSGHEIFYKSITKLPPVDVLIEEYKKGRFAREIGADYGVSGGAVWHALKKAGITLRQRGNQGARISEEEERQMLSLYESHPNIVVVGRMLKRGPQIVKRVLLARGVACGNADRVMTPEQYGRVLNQEGYVYVRIAADDSLRCMANPVGNVFEHRLTMARSLGRPLSEFETVHHINGDKSDNRIENLQLRQGKHGNGVAMVCADCGSHNIVHRMLD